VPSENELFKRFKDANPEDREDAARELYDAVQRHARAIIWMTLKESDYHVLEDLSHEIAKAALDVDRFKEESHPTKLPANKECPKRDERKRHWSSRPSIKESRPTSTPLFTS
jgi:hypothetical protein